MHDGQLCTAQFVYGATVDSVIIPYSGELSSPVRSGCAYISVEGHTGSSLGRGLSPRRPSTESTPEGRRGFLRPELRALSVAGRGGELFDCSTVLQCTIARVFFRPIRVIDSRPRRRTPQEEGASSPTRWGIRNG